MTVEEYRATVTREKRRAVLDAALAAFLKRGYDGTSMAQVARQADVSSATVYKHFPAKADLFGAIMERFWENEEGAAPPAPVPGNPRSGLTEIGRHYAGLLTRPDTVPLFRVVVAEVPRFPELGEKLYQLGKLPYLNRLRAYLEAEMKAGTLSITDVTLAKRQFLGMINDLVFWPRMLVPDAALSPDEVERVVDEAVETFVARYGIAQ